MTISDYLLLAALACWLAAALRACRKRGGCSGDCENCRGCRKQ